MTMTDTYRAPRMSFMDAVRTCMTTKYFRLSGRAQRAEFWWFYLFTIIVSVVVAIIDYLAFPSMADDGGPLGIIVSLIFLIPTITATVRRLHDTGRPGYFIFTPLVFAAAGIAVGAVLGSALGNASGIVVGIIIAAGFLLQLYWLIQGSQPGENKYGPHPRDGQSSAEVFE